MELLEYHFRQELWQGPPMFFYTRDVSLARALLSKILSALCNCLVL